MSPLQIKIALAYYCSSEPDQFFSSRQWLSEATSSVQQWLIDEKLIEWDAKSKNYHATERLQAYVHKLCSIPLPIAKTKWEFPEK